MNRISLPTFHPWTEAVVWIAGLAAVSIADPTASSWVELCVFKAVGFAGCPGCGLGHAMGFLVRGEWALALESHWLSPFVAGIILVRVFNLVRSGTGRFI